MTPLSALTIAGVVLWAVLVVIAQLLAPEQSPLRMGMSGLSRARHGWIMTLAFVVRGATALALVAAAGAGLAAAERSSAGLALFAVWGVGSILLAIYPTDMPGETPTRRGAAHATIAAIAYIAASAGMVLVSQRLTGDGASSGAARWALPIALVALLALLAQFAGFAAAAHSSERGLGRYAGLLQRTFLGLVMFWTVLVAAVV
jgi:hypothetical membrane protein